VAARLELPHGRFHNEFAAPFCLNPDLRGQQRAYFEEQLMAFASGSRRNDISKQMRSVARRSTAQEMAALAAYYPGAGGGDAR